jgi:hypothetical protein
MQLVAFVVCSLGVGIQIANLVSAYTTAGQMTWQAWVYVIFALILEGLALKNLQLHLKK